MRVLVLKYKQRNAHNMKMEDTASWFIHGDGFMIKDHNGKVKKGTL